MSDVVASPTPAADAGLSSTQAIASSTLETLENNAAEAADSSGDTGDPTPAGGDTAVEVTAETPGVVKPAPRALDPNKPEDLAEQLLRDAGFTDERRDDGREHRIPRSKTLKIIANAITEGKGAFGTRFQAVQQEAQTYKGQVERIAPLIETLEQGPDAFLAYAAQRDPRFKAFLEQRQAPAAPELPKDLPDPDFALPDGSRTYSIKGIRESLVPWIVAQAEAKAKAAAEAQYKPIAEREHQQRVEGQVRTRVQSQIEDARTWEGFKDHEPAIIAALQADSEQARAEGRRPALTLEAAYRNVVLPAFKADEAKIREKVLAELKSAPTSTAVSRSGAESVSPNAGKKTTADVAREVYNQLNR
jgi:hypothetical protein